MTASALILAGCATSKGNERQAQHASDQIRMVAVQREAQLQERQAASAQQVALVEALAEVAKANPEHAPSVAVALAVIGVKGDTAASGNAPIMGLQQQSNDALEWTKALAPTVGTLVSGLGVAAINASVTKNAQDANREIMLGDQATNARIVEAVAGLGVAGVENSGMSVGGSYYDLQDQAYVDNSTSEDTTTTTSTTTTYSQDTSYDASEDGFLVNGAYHYNPMYDSTVTYDGSETTLGGIIEYLQGLGSPYSLTLDGEVIAASTTGTGDTVTIDCTVPMFSPIHPDCV
jgi:hypothetical protein